jgi:hypothetical protein
VGPVLGASNHPYQMTNQTQPLAVDPAMINYHQELLALRQTVQRQNEALRTIGYAPIQATQEPLQSWDPPQPLFMQTLGPQGEDPEIMLKNDTY